MNTNCIKDPLVEWVKDDEGNALALVVRGECNPSKTQFLTPNEYNQQIGFIAYPKGKAVDTHMHLPVERKLAGTSEVIIIRQGRAVVRIYKPDETLIAKKELCSGDLLLLISGWHGIDFIEDTTILEVKQGPYVGNNEKIKMKKEECLTSSK